MSGERSGWPLLIASIVALAALQLWLRPLLPVDETRYLSVAWEMWSRGDFLVPYLNGEAYSHKPPLLFWMIHALWALFGVSELAARLLPVAFSLLALWWSSLLAVRLWPDQPAALSAMVPWLLFGGVFWMNFYTLVQFDLLLVLAALGAWLGLLRSPARPLSGWAMVALALGMGVLAKGPVVLLPLLPPLLLAPWWMGDERPGSWPRWYLGGLSALLLGLAIALAWAVPAGLAGGDAYRQAIFWGQSAGRVVASFAHRADWWSYLLWLPLMWLPWAMWPPVWRGCRRLSLDDRGVRFCLAVLLPAVLLFSLISGKQGKYLLPLFPVIALLMARGLVNAGDRGHRERLWPAAVLLLLAGLVLTLLPWWPQGPAWSAEVQPLWGPALLLWAIVLFRFHRKRMAAVRGMALAMWLGTGTLYLGVVDPLSPAYRLNPVAERLAALQESGHAIAWLGKYHGQFHFVGRLRQRIEPLAGEQMLRDWLARHPQGYLLVNYPDTSPLVPGTLLIQPYRGGSLVLWPAQSLLQTPDQLDALGGNA